jgi:NitT/TauT family transport system substrate-binding protein
MPKIVNEISGPIFSLPWLVAKDEGLFEKAGLDIDFVRAKPLTGYDYVEDPEKVPSIGPHRPFVEGEAKIYRACEWGQIRRSYDNEGGGRIVGKRSAVGVQALISAPGSRFTHPQTLKGQRIGVGFHTGTHYAALQLLEGFLGREDIKVVNVGPQEAYEAVGRGDLAAAALMDPWITLAEKNGYQKIAETHYQGSEIATAELDEATWGRITAVLSHAVKLINADKKKYLHHLINGLPPQYASQITPDDFHLPRLRYVEPAPYGQEEFQQTYDWLVSWGLVKSDSSFDELVINKIPRIVEPV